MNPEPRSCPIRASSSALTQGSPRLSHPRELRGGDVLVGTEVKSLRAGKVNLKDSYASIDDGELWLHGLHISPTSAQLQQSRPRALPQAPDLEARSEAPGGQGPGEGIHPRAPGALLQGRLGQGGDRPGPRQAAVRQAPRHRGEGRGPRPGPRAARGTGMSLPAKRRSFASAWPRGLSAWGASSKRRGPQEDEARDHAGADWSPRSPDSIWSSCRVRAGRPATSSSIASRTARPSTWICGTLP